VRLATFGALALYGVLRWATLLSGGATGRLLGLLALALLLAGAGAPLARRSRKLGALAAIVALLAGFAVAGVPPGWVVHLRVAVTASAIGEGLSALPGVLVPYAGVNEWVRMVIALGAGALLLDAALLLAFAPRALGDLRRAGAALPLVALATVPSTLVRPRFPYLDGLVLFALLAAFMWGERIRRQHVAAALVLCAVAATAGMVTAPALDRHTPWLDYRALAGGLAPAAVDRFDWSQGYGPINWPRHGRTVLEVRSSSREYWKAEDLDVFDGRGWTPGLVPGAASTPPPGRASIARWTRKIEVTVRDMRISELIGAGVTGHPAGLSQPVAPGLSPGTWTTGSDLGPGDSYVAHVYVPHPSAAQLSAAPDNYEAVPSGYRTIALPAATTSAPSNTASGTDVVFPAFHSRLPVQTLGGLSTATAAALLDGSPYAGAYRLARRLASGVPTPYAYAVAVGRWLAHGYSYSENPPRRPYPLESFLFADKSGYCQQFAGAMALLLRMGGVPSRVAVGFTSGTYDRSTHRWLVSDVDAHAWVEAWFPRYGWVRFDPTPASDPALGGRSPISSSASTPAPAVGASGPRGPRAGTPTTSSTATRQSGSSASGTGIAPLAVGVVIGSLGLLALLVLGTWPLEPDERLVAELERALARSGRPLAGGVTLTTLERRFGGSPEAAGYIRALRVRRFGVTAETPTPEQRRAFRAQLRMGLGPLGALRALWALPPRRLRRTRRARRAGSPEGA
jgi:hypothetical protein